MRIALPESIDTRKGCRIAKYLAQRFSISHLQAEIVNSPRNDLPSMDLTIANIMEKLNSPKVYSNSTKGFVLSNFPANITQAQTLDMALANIGQPLSCVLMPGQDTASNLTHPNTHYKTISRYYRAQNKLIFIDNWNDLEPTDSDLSNDTDNLSEIYGKIRIIYEKRRIR